VECFFTKKGNNLYCILPFYQSKFTLKNLKLPASAKATIPGAKNTCSWKQKGNDVELDLSAITANDISKQGIFAIRIANAL
jgi:alpha-L-fucosidase